nr:unnamed protein product [Callosobruchus analis]
MEEFGNKFEGNQSVNKIDSRPHKVWTTNRTGCGRCGNPKHTSQDAKCPAKERSCLKCRLKDNDLEFECRIDGVDVKMLVDLGCKHNLITNKSWQEMKRRKVIVSNQLAKPDKTFYSYGSKVPLKVMGSFDANLQAELYPTEVPTGPLTDDRLKYLNQSTVPLKQHAVTEKVLALASSTGLLLVCIPGLHTRTTYKHKNEANLDYSGLKSRVLACIRASSLPYLKVNLLHNMGMIASTKP